jgi:rhomboid protease GluP
MNPPQRMIGNWLTQKPTKSAFGLSLLIAIILFGLSYIFLTAKLSADLILIASPDLVFQKHEYWRAWTTLFIHADIEHLLSNTFLFVPLTYLLVGYYGPVYFPVVGIFIGGLVNLVVLKTLPPEVSLLGISGVVYWMGASWLTLYIIIDRRKKLRYRFAIALFLSLTLFIPEKYQPQVSYLSHLLGFVTGILSAFFLYVKNAKKWKAAEIYEPVVTEEFQTD